MFGLRDEFTYFQCSSCKCLQIAEFPDNISKYYSQENYYSFKTSDFPKYQGLSGYFKRVKVRNSVFANGFNINILRYFFRDKRTRFLGKVKVDFNSSILDVGCGNGSKFLYPLYESGFRNVLGCDPFINESVTYKNGLKIVKSDVFEMEGKWDLICFNHSFEHISNPLETLKKTSELLSKGGYCIIRIPTCSSFAWEHYGVNWFQLDAPRHYFLHSVESIEYLAQHANFNLAAYRFDSTHHQFTISDRYRMNKTISERVYTSKPGKFFHTFKKLFYMVKTGWLNATKKGDQAIFYLQKK